MKEWRSKGKKCRAFTIEQPDKEKRPQMVPCGKKVYKRWLCVEHYDQGRELASYRNRFAAHNPKRHQVKDNSPVIEAAYED